MEKYERKDDIEERDEEKYCCHSPMYEEINEEINEERYEERNDDIEEKDEERYGWHSPMYEERE